MPKVSSSVLVSAPREAVFRLTQDYHLRKAWDPFVREMRFLDGAVAPEVGVRVWVRARNGLAMTVEYVSFRPPKVVAVRMTDGPAFLRVFGGVWRFEDVAGSATRVTFEYGFRTRWRWLRPVLDRAVGWVFGRDVRARLKALRQAVAETDLLARLDARADAVDAEVAP